jgi:hypothetical protein
MMQKIYPVATITPHATSYKHKMHLLGTQNSLIVYHNIVVLPRVTLVAVPPSTASTDSVQTVCESRCEGTLNQSNVKCDSISTCGK